MCLRVRRDEFAMRLMLIALVAAAMSFHAELAQGQQPHPFVISIDRDTTTQLRFPKMLRVTISEPLTKDDLVGVIHSLEKSLSLGRNYTMRIVLPGWPSGYKQAISGVPTYAWRLVDGNEQRYDFDGLSRNDAAKRIDALKLRPGEELKGIWVDHYDIGGIFALTMAGGQNYIRPVGSDNRWRMRDGVKDPGGRWLVAIDTTDEKGRTYKADGDGDSRRGVLISHDGTTMRVFEGGFKESIPGTPTWVAIRWSRNPPR